MAGMQTIPLADAGNIVAAAHVTVGIFTAVQAFVRTLTEGESRSVATKRAKKDILESNVFIPAPLMSLLEDPSAIVV